MTPILMLLTLLGILVVGYLLSLIIVPLFLYILDKTICLLAFCLCGFPLTKIFIKKFVKSYPCPTQQRNTCEDNIYLPYPIHNLRDFIVNKYNLTRIPKPSPSVNPLENCNNSSRNIGLPVYPQQVSKDRGEGRGNTPDSAGG